MLFEVVLKSVEDELGGVFQIRPVGAATDAYRVQRDLGRDTAVRSSYFT